MSRAELGLRHDASVFWCGQSLYKYLPQYDEVFGASRAKPAIASSCSCAIAADPDHRTVRERLERAFAGVGLRAADHCVFLARLSQSKFVAAIGLCDVFLDSIGWSGCNSALESLPHNLPIVTRPALSCAAAIARRSWR